MNAKTETQQRSQYQFSGLCMNGWMHSLMAARLKVGFQQARSPEFAFSSPCGHDRRHLKLEEADEGVQIPDPILKRRAGQAPSLSSPERVNSLGCRGGSAGQNDQCLGSIWSQRFDSARVSLSHLNVDGSGLLRCRRLHLLSETLRSVITSTCVGTNTSHTCATKMKSRHRGIDLAFIL